MRFGDAMTPAQVLNLDKTKFPSFSVFARGKLPLPGIKLRLDQILNREILVTDFRIMKSKHHPGQECLQFQYLLDNQVCVSFTGSGVLMDQISSVGDNIPFNATIVKIDRYYSFS